MRQLTRLTQPALEPLEVEDLAAWVGASLATADGAISVSDSVILEALIIEQREFLENWLGRALISSTWRMLLSADEVQSEIMLPMPPLVSVESVTVTDYLDASTVVSPADVYVVLPGENGRISLRYDAVWSDSPLREAAAMQIDFTAGYGADPQSIPGVLRVALRELVTFFYMNRGAGFLTNRMTGGNTPTPDHVALVQKRVEFMRVLRQG
jgi:uncharacterized phiE125 gp8 family phage protein